MSSNKKTIGIMGGMGSEATLDLFRAIVDNTLALNDSEHLPVIIYNNTAIPDRSAFILGAGPDPVPLLVDAAVKLESWGADFIIIPCNTAHYFIDDILSEVNVPVLNMIEESAKWLSKTFPELKYPGLLSTLGTYKTGIYSDIYKKNGLEIVLPDEVHRKNIMNAIYGRRGIKAGYKKGAAGAVQDAINELLDNGAEAIITACTELPLILDFLEIRVPVVNPTFILAIKSIEMAGGKVRGKIKDKR